PLSTPHYSSTPKTTLKETESRLSPRRQSRFDQDDESAAPRHVPVRQIRPSFPMHVIRRLRQRELVIGQRQPLVARVVIQPCVVLAEDRVLQRAVRGAERRVAILLLEVFGHLEPAQRLDLPLRRAGPA